jgi:hypothetical protein
VQSFDELDAAGKERFKAIVESHDKASGNDFSESCF